MRISDASWVFLDTETTGIPRKGQPDPSIIELGLVRVERMRVAGTDDFLINPGAPLPPEITRITHITDEDLAGKPGFGHIAQHVMNELQRADFLAAFNKDFDRRMLELEFAKVGMHLPEKVWLDPLTWSRAFEGQVDHKLGAVAERFKEQLTRAHRADADAEVSAKILMKFFEWGVEEANFPDDLEQLKALERGWRSSYRAQQNIMRPLKDPATGKVKFTGEPGVLPNVADAVDRHLQREFEQRGSEWMYRLLREKWGRMR